LPGIARKKARRGLSPIAALNARARLFYAREI
jgi:hypothetical protein